MSSLRSVSPRRRRCMVAASNVLLLASLSLASFAAVERALAQTADPEPAAEPKPESTPESKPPAVNEPPPAPPPATAPSPTVTVPTVTVRPPAALPRRPQVARPQPRQAAVVVRPRRAPRPVTAQPA